MYNSQRRGKDIVLRERALFMQGALHLLTRYFALLRFNTRYCAKQYCITWVPAFTIGTSVIKVEQSNALFWVYFWLTSPLTFIWLYASLTAYSRIFAVDAPLACMPVMLSYYTIFFHYTLARRHMYVQVYMELTVHAMLPMTQYRACTAAGHKFNLLLI